MQNGIFQIPNLSTILGTTSENATVMFNWMLPTALYFLGIILGSIVLYWLIGVITDGVRAILAKKTEGAMSDERGATIYTGGSPTFMEYFRYYRGGGNDPY